MARARTATGRCRTTTTRFTCTIRLPRGTWVVTTTAHAASGVVAQGTPAEVMNHPDSLTGKYLSGREHIRYPAERTPRDAKRLLKLN